MKIGKLLLPLCVFALTAMVSYPVHARHKHKVQSSELTTEGKCKIRNTFNEGDPVFAQGKFFPPNENVDIYVTDDRSWSPGDSLSGLDVSDDGPNFNVATDSNGKILCTDVAYIPGLLPGDYDIVVDANQDGTFDKKDGDAVDGKNGRGFRVQ